MKVSIEKAPDPYHHYVWCDNPDCRQLPEYFHYPVSETLADAPYVWGGRRLLKEGSIVAVVDMSLGTTIRKFFFCRDCIDLVYRDVKMAMDSALWAFH